MFSMAQIGVILLVGAGAGVMVGIMGGSGVMVVVPMLTLLLSFPVHTAIGTSLLIDVIATVVTTYTYYRHQNVYVKPGLWIAFGSVAGAQAGSLFADMIPPLGMSNLFGLMLIPMGVLMWTRGIGRTVAYRTDNNSESATGLPVQTGKQQLTALGLGVVVGVMCGLFGAGGGGMILLILIFVLHYPVHVAVGTSSFIMLMTAASGAAGYMAHGNLDVYVALIASASALLAAGLGALIANRVSEKSLGHIIGAVLVVLGVVMLATQHLPVNLALVRPPGGAA